MNKDEKRLEKYKPLRFFQKHAPKTNTGFVKFTVGDEHFFAYFFGRKLILISESYKSLHGRDNGVESTTTNMQDKTRYRFERLTNGKNYFNIVAGNHQVIATSVWFGSKSVAKAMADILVGDVIADDGDAEYRALAFYETHMNGVRNGFDIFKADDGHYFTHNQDGKVILMSRSYHSEADRDRVIDSLIRYMQVEDRYEYRTLTKNQHDFRIVGANDEEITRSCMFALETDAQLAATKLQQKHRRAAVQVAPLDPDPQKSTASESVSNAPTPQLTPTAPDHDGASGANAKASTAGGPYGWVKWVLLSLIVLAALWGLSQYF